jgi:hypothetical protein
LSNPGLGDCVVRHISDYGNLGSEDFDAASIGNDPGILIASTATPNIGYISIDVKAAMQGDINNGRPYSAFMIRMATTTDGDSKSDSWNFFTSEQGGTSQDPYIEYSLTTPAPIPTPRPVGGVLMPTNKLEILAPYMALIVLVGTIFMVATNLRRRIA